MLKANDVAKWFIYNNPKLSSGYIDENTKVNKLLYFSNLMYYCISEENMIEDDFVAFKNGPVVYSVYRDYRYGNLSLLPNSIESFDDKYLKVLNIINFIYSDMSRNDLVEESHTHSLWKNVSHLVPKYQPKIEFSNVEDDLKDYYKLIYDAYKNIDFSKMKKEKICGNTYFYNIDEFELTEDIINELSNYNKFDEPKFLEYIDGNLVVS